MLQVTALSSGGESVRAATVADPRTVLTDYLDGRGRLSGGPRTLGTGDVVVRVPADEAVASLQVTGPGIAAPLRVELPPVGTTATPAPVPWPSTTIVQGGPSSSAVDVVFLGDGYTAAELGTYVSDVAAATNHLLAEPPFAALHDRINVHRVDVVSNESGADDECAGIDRDTALDSAYHSTGSDCRALYSSSFEKIADAALSAPAADTVMVLVNSAMYGGSAFVGGTAFAYNRDARDEVVAHEFGHSFGLLGDEYDYGGSGPWPGGDPGYPNSDDIADRASLKWRDWVDPSTPLPTASTSDDLAGAYVGSNYYQSGVYRPTYDSKMRNLNRPYERVNAELLTRQVMAYGPADPTPPSATIMLHPGAGGGPATVDVAAADPETRLLGYQLSNTGDFSDSAMVPVGLGTTFSTSTTWSLPPGANTVWLRARNGAGTDTVTAASLGGTRPDLLVANLQWTPANPVRGNAVTFSATVTNIGSVATPAGTTLEVGFYVDGARVTWSNTSTAALVPGASRTLVANAGTSGPGTWSATDGSHTISAIVDDPNRIVESDEANNSRSASLSVQAGSISGYMRRTDGSGIAGAIVTVVGGPSAYGVTAADGYYTIAGLPAGSYTVRAGMCFTPARTIVVDGAERADFTSSPVEDAKYKCRRVTSQYVEAQNVLALSGDNASRAVALPFTVTLFGTAYNTAYVSTNGFVSFSAAATNAANTAIPNTAAPNAAVYPFWDDLVVDAAASVRTFTSGRTGSRTFVVEWRNVRFASDATKRISFEAWFYEDKRIRFEYHDIDGNALERGRSATIGIENGTGTVATQVERDTVTVGNNEAIVFEAKAPK